MRYKINDITYYKRKQQLYICEIISLSSDTYGSIATGITFQHFIKGLKYWYWTEDIINDEDDTTIHIFRV